MSGDNGKQVKTVLKVELSDGGMKVTFGDVNLALISHAVRMASLEVDNQIIENTIKKEVEAKDKIIKLRDGFIQ